METRYLVRHRSRYPSRPRASALGETTVGVTHHLSLPPWSRDALLWLSQLILSKVRDRFGGQLKVSFVGGAATSMEVLNFFENLDIKILEGYGLTETSPLVTVNTPEQVSGGRALCGCTSELRQALPAMNPGADIAGGFHSSIPPVRLSRPTHAVPSCILQKYRRLGTTGRCLEGVNVKIFDGCEELPVGEVRERRDARIDKPGGPDLYRTRHSGAGHSKGPSSSEAASRPSRMVRLCSSAADVRRDACGPVP